MAEEKSNRLKRKIEDITGKCFSKLTVVSFHHVQNGISYWNCLCDCGSNCVVRLKTLHSGGIHSCGCSRYDALIKDISGQRFGRLVAVSYHGTIRTNAHWVCVCDCGSIPIIVSGNNLRRGHSNSCGCYKEETNRDQHRTHGLSATSAYKSWFKAKSRCFDKSDNAYHNYGGRGIAMCERWRNSFELFFLDMGERPIGMTLERKNVNGNYYPSNCIWASRKEQSNNTRRSIRILYKGETLTFMELSERTGISPRILYRRYRKLAFRLST